MMIHSIVGMYLQVIGTCIKEEVDWYRQPITTLNHPIGSTRKYKEIQLRHGASTGKGRLVLTGYVFHRAVQSTRNTQYTSDRIKSDSGRLLGLECTKCKDIFVPRSCYVDIRRLERRRLER